MNKTELVAAVAEQAEVSKKDAEKALKAFVDVVTDELKKGEKVQLVGFGTFEVSPRLWTFTHSIPERLMKPCSGVICGKPPRILKR